MKKACAVRVDEIVRVVSTPNHSDFNLQAVLQNFLKLWDQNSLRHKSNDELPGIICKADERLRRISSLLAKHASEGQNREADLDALSTLESVNEVLDQVAGKLQAT